MSRKVSPRDDNSNWPRKKAGPFTFEFKKCSAERSVIGQRIILPSSQVRPGKRNWSNDSLPVIHKTWTEIDAAHVLYENIQRLATFEVHLQ
jgi:hypothetical protein